VIDTLALRLFVQVAKHGSYSAAGRELGYTQPAVTYQIHNLERAVGAPLTMRRGRDTVLTDAGRELLSHAEHILAAIHSAERAMAAFAGGPRGSVRLAAFPSCYATIVAEAVADVQSLHPEVQLTLIEAEPHEARRRVRAGESDIAVGYRFAPSDLNPPGRTGAAEDRPEERAGLITVPLMADPMSVVLPLHHQAAQRPTASLADLADDTFLINSNRFAGMLAVAGARHGFSPKIVTVADDFVAMQTMVALGMGVALVPQLALAAHRDTRTVARRLPEWPDRLVEIELWPDLMRLDAVKAVVEGLQRAASRLTATR